jgi:3-oxoacyl-[acyl-carrier-protein] synthase-3
MTHARITGIGSYLPEGLLTNADLERMVDTSDEWIMQRVGISERRIVGPGESSSDLAARAALAAVADAGIEPGDVDMLIATTSSPDYSIPSTACMTIWKMGIACPAFDVMAACTGFVYGIQVAVDAIAAGRARNVVVVGAEAVTRHIDFTDRSTCVLFGDGAGAVVLSAAEEPGVMCVELAAEGAPPDTLSIPVGSAAPPTVESCTQREHYLRMAGGDVYKFALRAVPEITQRVLAKCGLAVDDLRWLVPHQANQRIMDGVAERLGMPAEKVFSNIRDVGNTSSASIPLALDRLYTTGNLAAGDLVGIVGFGAGLTWGAAVIRWTKEAR